MTAYPHFNQQKTIKHPDTFGGMFLKSCYRHKMVNP